MATIVKIDDTTVAEIREVRNCYGKTELVKRKESLETNLAQVEELLAAFK